MMKRKIYSTYISPKTRCYYISFREKNYFIVQSRSSHRILATDLSKDARYAPQCIQSEEVWALEMSKYYAHAYPGENGIEYIKKKKILNWNNFLGFGNKYSLGNSKNAY